MLNHTIYTQQPSSLIHQCMVFLQKHERPTLKCQTLCSYVSFLVKPRFSDASTSQRIVKPLPFVARFCHGSVKVEIDLSTTSS